MLGPVLMIGISVIVIVMVLNILLTKLSSQGNYVVYFPTLVVFGAGLAFCVIAAMAGKIPIFDLGLGGWGIAFLFAAAICGIATSIVDSYNN